MPYYVQDFIFPEIWQSFPFQIKSGHEHYVIDLLWDS
jgi:hypothetical protein